MSFRKFLTRPIKGLAFFVAGTLVAIPVMVIAASYPLSGKVSSSVLTGYFGSLDTRIANLEAKFIPKSLKCMKQGPVPGAPWLSTCPTGWNLTGGGCDVVSIGAGPINLTKPDSDTTWTCDAYTNLAGAYSICCQLQ
jgi:hypothetical protein